ncbi:MAG TPA: hypothetical protein VMJ10_10605 [Kofleriaceae bacterium]|nr:hypothetical protein [Kofleriaceae bacterium]
MMRTLLVALFVTAFATTASAQFARPPRLAPAAIDRTAVRAALGRARGHNLAAFRAYVKRGTYPSNTFSDGRLNVWQDTAGHLCAAATIIDASGEHALVQRIAAENNFIRLADVSSGPLMDWILASGFTQAEISAIQEPFSSVTSPRREIDRDKRLAEDTRLRSRYAEVDRQLVRDEQHSLDIATDRLLAQPELARAVLAIN